MPARLNALCCPSEFNGVKMQLGKEVGGHPGEISCAVTSSISLGKEIRDQKSEIGWDKYYAGMLG